MDMPETLAKAQDAAHEMLVDQFDAQRGIPVRTGSHSDLWPGDRWPEAYLATGEPSIALAAINSIASSVRRDGSFPHLLSGSHKRGGVETHWIDRMVYIGQGNGLTLSVHREWVTRAFAPPTQALSALAIEKAGLHVPAELDVTGLTNAAMRLYKSRGNEDGLLVARKKDELTRSKAELSRELKQNDTVIDPAINALMVLNNDAIAELAARTRQPLGSDFRQRMQQTRDSLLRRLASHQDSYLPEQVLAVARLGHRDVVLTEDDLADIFTAPVPDDPHPQEHHLSMAETIEVARLTTGSRMSYDYLRRILTLVAGAGPAALTQFEGINPGDNPILNKYNRKNAWLPTAAEIVQIDRTML
jgi:hypothetical protein